MILPQGVKDMSYEELVTALVEQEQYSQSAAEYIAGKVKGKIKDGRTVQ